MKNQNQDKELIDIEGEVYLPSWNGFQSRKSIYGSKDSSNEIDCVFYYSIGGDSTLEIEKPKPYQQKAFEYLINNHENIKNEILSALLKKYPEIQNIYGYEPEDKEEFMPDVTNPNDFKKLIGLSQLHFVNVTKDDVGFIGFEFGCEWDDEHGLGIMTHKNRVIEIGGADTSFMEWIAMEDLTDEARLALEIEQDLEFQKQRNKESEIKTKSPWWKFWK